MNKIYFLCTGNSCRSQMAEGYAKVLLKDQYECQSAGVEIHGLNPYAVEAMAEDGIDISHQKSKLIDLDYFNSADLIVTLCGDARDRCPVIPPQTQSIHWPLPDPAQATGTNEQKMIVFRQVRDKIKRLVIGLA
jgi:arsenate reductase